MIRHFPSNSKPASFGRLLTLTPGLRRKSIFIMSQIERKIITQNKLRGVVIDNELVQRRRGSVHMLRRPAPAWAVGDDVLTVARTLGAVAVRIVDTDSGAEYVASMETLDAHGRHRCPG